MSKLRERLDNRVYQYKRNLEACSYILISKCDQCGDTSERLVIADFDNYLPDRLETHMSDTGSHECSKEKRGVVRLIGVRRLNEND